MTVVDALAREVGSVAKALHRLKGADWERPTRCAPMSVKDLVAHMARGGARIVEMTAQDPIDDEPEKDGVTYFRYDAAAEAPSILKRAQGDASAVETRDMPRYWDESWSKGLRAARDAIAKGDAVYPGLFGSMRITEYLRTRAVEVVVHHLDLDDALGHDPHPDAEALEIVGDVLRGLLGTDLRGAGVDDVRFALIGTGRAPLNERERGMLGPLADLFPLLA